MFFKDKLGGGYAYAFLFVDSPPAERADFADLTQNLKLMIKS